MGLISDALAEIEYLDMKHVAKLNKKAKQQAINKYRKEHQFDMSAENKLLAKNNTDAIWVRTHNIENPEIVRTKYEINSLSNSIARHISLLHEPLALLKKKSSQDEANIVNHLNESLKELSSEDYLNSAILNNDFSWAEKYDSTIKSIDSIAIQMNNKKINKSLSEYHSKDLQITNAVERLSVLIENLNQELKSQKTELNSGKNVGANDPQKAEKLAKIAKLQRELDELKGEVSDSIEPEIVDKNN